MKPVNLLPGDVAVAKSAEPAKPNMGMIGGAVAGVVAVVGVAGYFAFSHVESIKDETTQAQLRAEQATTQTASVRSQIQSLGQPIVDSDRQLAQGAETVLVAAYSERHDFVQLADELRAIMDPKGWYESVEASVSATDGGDTGVKIVAYLPTKELAASFNERVKSTRTMAKAKTVAISSEHLRDVDTRRPGVYYKITVTAELVDTVAPNAGSSGGGAPGDGTGTVVGNGGGDTQLSLSLDPKPRGSTSSTTASSAPAKPKNPFDIAAGVAVRGGGS